MKIALFASHQPSVRVSRFLSNSDSSDEVVALYLTGNEPHLEKQIIDELSISQERVFKGRDIFKDENHYGWLREQNLEGIICVYWPWLLPQGIINLAKVTVNFHPAFLPINRGWHPHVHSILDGTKTGVTLHKLAELADAGDIWAQKEVNLLPTDSAADIYERLQQEITLLFEQKWKEIKLGKITPQPQDERIATYHSKREVDELNFVDLEKLYTGRELINLLRARTFGDRAFAYFVENGEKIYLNLRLSKSQTLD